MAAGLMVVVAAGEAKANEPFLAALAGLGDRAPVGVRLHVWAGGHDSAYWHAHYRDYLRFYAGALATC